MPPISPSDEEDAGVWPNPVRRDKERDHRLEVVAQEVVSVRPLQCDQWQSEMGITLCLGIDPQVKPVSEQMSVERDGQHRVQEGQ